MFLLGGERMEEIQQGQESKTESVASERAEVPKCTTKYGQNKTYEIIWHEVVMVGNAI